VVPCDFVCEGVIRFSGFSGDMEIDISTFIFKNTILNPLLKTHNRRTMTVEQAYAFVLSRHSSGIYTIDAMAFELHRGWESPGH
jgi:hypothetical protein